MDIDELVRCTRREFLSTAFTFASPSLCWVACRDASAASVLSSSANSNGVTVHEITMVTPDIVCIEYRDGNKVPGEVYKHGTVETGNYDHFVTRTHPTRGTLPAQILGKNKEYWWFADVKPTQFVDRAAVDNVANWGTIGGRTVHSVHRRTTPYCEGYNGAAADLFSVMRHRVYLKLSGNLSKGTHTIIHPAALRLANSSFVFNDKTTRCRAIKGIQTGHRPGDAQKKAFLGEWIPFYGTEGAVEFAYYLRDKYVFDHRCERQRGGRTI